MPQTRTRHRTLPTALLAGALALACLAGCEPMIDPGPADEQGAAVGVATDEQEQAADAATGGQQAGLDLAETSGQPATPSIPTIGKLGSFTARTLDGATFTQDDIAARDVTVVNLWSTTCGPCINEMPSIAQFAAALPANVGMVTICSDGVYNGTRAQEVLELAGLDAPTIVTITEDDGGFGALLDQIVYTPTTFFVASDGTVVGELLVGAPVNLASAYLSGINNALAWQDKEAVELEA